MNKFIPTLLTATLLSGHVLATDTPTQPTGWDCLQFAYGFGLGYSSGSLDGRVTTNVAQNNSLDKFRPSSMTFDAHMRAYCHRFGKPIFLSAGITLLPHYKANVITGTYPGRGSASTSYRQRWVANLMLGIELFQYNRFAFAVLGGMNYRSVKLYGTINEIAGGGALNYYTKNFSNVNGSLGAEMRFNLTTGWDALFNYTANRVPSNSFRINSVTLNNPYTFKNGSAWQHHVKLTFQYRF